MEVLESHSDNDASGPLLECAYGSLNLRNVFFGGGGVDKVKFFHHIILVELHVHEDSLYYHDTSGIDFHKPFLIFIQMLVCTGWYVFNSHKLYTM